MSYLRRKWVLVVLLLAKIFALAHRDLRRTGHSLLIRYWAMVTCLNPLIPMALVVSWLALKACY